ncbi:MAG: DUF2786 domain-containing protein [Aldersonia sp.]|nr:DUF2786 domain-containing protein [Aldersonia sp.]
MSSEKVLTRIGGLLRQAESTDNEHEAAAFMAAAQRLATQSSIDLAVARSHVAQRERRPVPVQRMITIGEPGKKGLRTFAQLFLLIAAANDVRCDITQTSTVVYAYGFDTDIDTCEALYSSLLVQMVRASDAYIKSGAYRKELTDRLVTETRRGRRVQRWTRAPVAAVTARLNFQLAFADRIGQRLAAAKQEAEQEAVEHDRSSSTALALRDKEIELHDFYSETSEARGTWRGARATIGHSSAARRAGDRAGRNARLGTAPELAGPRGQLQQ